MVTRDTVAEGWLPPGGAPLTSGERSGKVFGPRMLLGVLPEGSVAFSDSSAYEIRIARPGTGVWRVLRRPLRPIPVTNRMIDAERNRQLERLDESGVHRDGRTWGEHGGREATADDVGRSAGAIRCEVR